MCLTDVLFIGCLQFALFHKRRCVNLRQWWHIGADCWASARTVNCEWTSQPCQPQERLANGVVSTWNTECFLVDSVQSKRIFTDYYIASKFNDVTLNSWHEFANGPLTARKKKKKDTSAESSSREYLAAHLILIFPASVPFHHPNAKKGGMLLWLVSALLSTTGRKWRVKKRVQSKHSKH